VKNKFFTLKNKKKINFVVIGRFELTTSRVQNQKADILLQ
jgi:hypothetical protein